MDPHSQILTHPTGNSTRVIVDDFTDPWKPSETILIQHGFGRHAHFWYHWVPLLSRHYRVIRRDTRGHGFSSSPKYSEHPEAYRLDTIISELVDTLDQLEVDKVHFLGESTSGMLGEILAAKHPERLQSLTICSSPSYLPEVALKLFAFGHETWPTACRKLGSRGWAQALGKVPGTIASPEPAYAQWWEDQIALSSSEGLAGYAEFLSTLDARPYLSQIKVPMLILAPTRSAATTVADQKEIQKQVQSGGGSCKLVEVDGKGHEIYVDKPEDCQKALLDFLGGLKSK